MNLPIRKTIKNAFVIPTCLIILIIGIVSGFFSHLSMSRTINERVENEIARLNINVSSHIEGLFDEAESILEQNSALIGKQQIDSRSSIGLRKMFVDQASFFEVPTSLYFGNTQGGLAVGGHDSQQQRYYEIFTENFVAGTFFKQMIATDTQPAEVTLSLPNYDARSRPWYRNALRSMDQVVWGDLYVVFTGHDLALAPSRAVVSPTGALLGVVGIDIFVSAVSAFLGDAMNLPQAVSFLVDPSGLLIATSDASAVFETDERVQVSKRIDIRNSSNPLIAVTAPWVRQWLTDLKPRTGTIDFGTWRESDDLLLSARVLGNGSRPKWGFVTVVPKTLINNPLQDHLQKQFAIIAVGLFITVLAVVFIARRVSAPIEDLAFAVETNHVDTVLDRTRDDLEEIAVLKSAIVLADAKVKSSMTELNALRVEAEAANQAKSDFLANMSHELRTPLNAILGFAQMISSGALGRNISARYREYGEDIHKSGKHLLHIVNDILDLAKVESGTLELYPTEFVLAESIQECVGLVSALRPDNSPAIEISLENDSTTLFADIRVFRQILINILSNAVKFTPSDKRVRITAAVNFDGTTLVRVQDEGIGIPAGRIQDVLKPFGQARTDAALSHEGTGLGLSLSAMLMDIQGGKLEIMSAPGSGTSVSLIFPAREDNYRAEKLAP